MNQKHFIEQIIIALVAFEAVKNGRFHTELEKSRYADISSVLSDSVNSSNYLYEFALITANNQLTA